MTDTIVAEKRSNHFAQPAVASPQRVGPGGFPTVSPGSITFENSVGVSVKTYGRSNPTFLFRSKAIDSKSGDTFTPLQASPGSYQVEGSFGCYHGHLGIIVGPKRKATPAAINCGLYTQPPPECSATLMAMIEELADRFAKEAFGNGAGGLLDTYNAYQNGKQAAVDSYLKALPDRAKGAWDTFTGFVGAAWDKTKDIVSNPIDNIKAAGRAVGEAYDAAVSAVTDALEFLDDMTWEDFKEAAKETLKELLAELGCDAADVLANMLNDKRPIAEQIGELEAQAELAVIEGGVEVLATRGALGGAAKVGKALGGIGKHFDKLIDRAKQFRDRRKAGNTGKANGPDKTKQPEAEKKPDPAQKDGNVNKEQRDNPDCACVLKGSPVSPTYGAKLLSGGDDEDFVLAGRLPLTWGRTYASNNPRVGVLGQGWALPFELRLERSEGLIRLVDGYGRKITLREPRVGGEVFHRQEHLTIRRLDADRYQLAGSGGELVDFVPLHTSGPYFGPARFAPSRLADRNGNTIHFAFEPELGLLSQLLGSAGQVLECRYLNHPGGPRLLFVQQVELPPGAPHFQNLEAANVWLADAEKQSQLPRQRLVTYSYTPEGDLATVVAADGTLTREFSWQNHLMVRHRTAGGLVAEYAYDRLEPDGRVTRHWDSLGGCWTFDYAPGLTTVTDALGRVEQFHYAPETKRLQKLVDAQGRETVLDHDGWGNLLSRREPGDRLTKFVNDERGRSVQTTGPDGTSRLIAWHPVFDLPLRITDAVGRSIAFRYDERGNLLQEVAPDGATTTYTLDTRGLPVLITDARGGTKTLAYNRFGQITSYTDCSKRTTHFTYDSRGRLCSVIDPTGATTCYEYDVRDHLTAVIAADGGKERYAYDAAGRLIAYSDPQGAVTRYTLAEDGLPLERRDANGAALTYGYDAARRLVSLTNENGAVYRFAYDVLNRLVAEMTFDGKVTYYRYDDAGFLVEQTEEGTGSHRPDGSRTGETAATIQTRYTRDPAGRLLARHIVGPASPGGQAAHFEYDAAGQLRVARNQHAAVRVAYDDAGRPVVEALQTQGQYGGRELVIRHDYDVLGNRSATTLPDGRVVNFVHYGSGHLHQVNIDGEVISDFERDIAHREVARSQGELVSRYEYDTVGRLVSQITRRGGFVEMPAEPAGPDLSGFLPATGHRFGGPQAPRRPVAEAPAPTTAIFQRRYRYDLAGQLIARQDGQQITRYTYDPVGQLHTVQGRRDEMFAFDPAHNRVDPGHMAPDNRVHAVDGWRYTYDAFGRVATKEKGATRYAYTWDDQHQLEEVHATRNGLTQATRYSYDAFGRRLAKHGRFGSTWFTWDGSRLLLEQHGSRLRTFLYEPGSFVPLAQVETSATPVLGPPKPPVAASPYPPRRKTSAELARDYFYGIEQPTGPDRAVSAEVLLALARPDFMEAGARVLYYHCDHLGTPQELTDAHGNLIWQAEYLAWGNTVKLAYPEWEKRVQARMEQAETRAGIPELCDDDIDSLPAHQPLRFQGQYFDAESGLHYNRFRYYDPDAGRFMSHDPIGLRGGTNLQRYAANPTGWIDPLGLAGLPGGGIILLGEGQQAVEEAARLGGFRAIGADWPKGMPNLRGLKPYSPEWKAKMCEAIKFNVQWIRDRAAEGYQFYTIGTTGSNSPYYKAEMAVLKELGMAPTKITSVGPKGARTPIDDIRKKCTCSIPMKPWQDFSCD